MHLYQTENQCETNVWQHANGICLSFENKLRLALATKGKMQFTFGWVRLVCINRQPLWQGVWLGGGPQIPLKGHSSPVGCLFEDGESNKEEEGGDRQSVVVVAVSVPVSVYAFMQLDADIAQQWWVSNSVVKKKRFSRPKCASVDDSEARFPSWSSLCYQQVQVRLIDAEICNWRLIGFLFLRLS